MVYGLSAVMAATSKSRTCCLAYCIMKFIVFCSLTGRAFQSSISWLFMCSVIINNILVCSYVLISWPRSIPIFWTEFSHVFCVSLDEFLSPYVNMTLHKALNIPGFAFSLLVMLCYTLLVWLNLPLPLPLPHPNRLSLPLAIAVDCC